MVLDSDIDIDIDHIRSDTPAVANLAHFNNCGSSLPPIPVLDATIDYLRLEASIGGYEAAAQEEDALNRVYAAGSRLLHCDPGELAFMQSAAQGWRRAFDAVPLTAGDKVLVSTTEYQSNGFGFLQAEAAGVQVEVVPPTGSGEIDLEALESMLDDRVKLVSLTHIALSNGMVQPAAEVGRLVADTPALYLLDACQSAGQLPLDVADLHCDFLAFTGRKFMRGPRGTALLYARQSVLEQLRPPGYLDGRSAIWTTPQTYELQPGAQRYELGEYNYAGKVGLGVAIDYAVDIGVDLMAERIGQLAAQMRDGLAAVPGVEVYDQGVHKSGIVTFGLAGHDPLAVSDHLRSLAINTSVPDHTAAQLDLGVRGIDKVVRAGVHYFNTEQEVEKLVDAVASMA